MRLTFPKFFAHSFISGQNVLRVLFRNLYFNVPALLLHVHTNFKWKLSGILAIATKIASFRRRSDNQF